MHQLHKKTKGAFLTLLLTLPLLFAGCGETGNYGYYGAQNEAYRIMEG